MLQQIQAVASRPSCTLTTRQVAHQAAVPRVHPFQLCRQQPGVQRFAQARRAVVAQAGASKYANIVQVDAEGLEAEILGRDRPLIIDFYATWCGPCVLLAKELETVAEKMGDSVRILKIDTDENPEISTQLQIHGLPTLVFVGMDPSKPALRTEGLLPAQVIQDIVERDLQGGGEEQKA